MIGNGADRYFRGGESGDPLEAFPQEHVVKIHESVDAATFDLSDYAYERVLVDPGTMHNLRIAQETLRQVKMIMPYDSGNQATNVAYTGGESWARAQMFRESGLSDNLVHDASRAAAHQAGYCSEMSDIAYTLLSERRIPAPVISTSDMDWDHGYVLIGDPRDSRWGEKNTVVVDPWVRYPSATILTEAQNRRPDAASLYSTENRRAPNERPNPDAAKIHDIVHVSADAVTHFLNANEMELLGPVLVEQLRASRISDSFYDKLSVARDPSTIYFSQDEPFGTAMDDIAHATVERQKRVSRVQNPY